MILNRARNFKYDRKIREDFLKDFIYTPDGQASFRAENEIIKVINNNKKYEENKD